MYRIDGSSDLTEEILPHWEGYRGSAPVRIGNGAADQLQLDIYGEAIDSIYFADQHGLDIGHDGWQRVCDLLDWVAENWDQPEEGIWETRGGRQDFTYGRLMNWVALDRGIRLATSHGRPAPLDRWRAERDAIYNQVMDRGWSPTRQAFRQHYDTDVLDASLLRMSAVGFITPTDPMWTSTLKAMDGELVTDSLVYRYDPAASPDGLRGSEGTFSLCTFAYVDVAGPGRPARQGTRHVREDADLRQPPRPLLRGDRAHRRADRQLPPGVHPPVPHRRGHHAGPAARPQPTGGVEATAVHPRPAGSRTGGGAGEQATAAAAAPTGA